MHALSIVEKTVASTPKSSNSWPSGNTKSGRSFFAYNFAHAEPDSPSSSSKLSSKRSPETTSTGPSCPPLKSSVHEIFLYLQVTRETSFSRAISTRSSIVLISRTSSPSTNIMYSPVQCLTPKLRAEESPPFILWRILTRESASTTLSINSTVSSVEPSSTMIISRLAYVCTSSDLMHEQA